MPARAHFFWMFGDDPAKNQTEADSAAPAKGVGAAAADPDATKLLAEARAARARWEGFPGFTADLEVNIEGKVTKGHVQVNSRGKLEMKLNDEAADKWARGILGSTVGHRLDNSTSLNTPCNFLDDNADHPLGRAIRVLNDEFHSSYRIRDRQIIVVNRQMGDVRFTITVLENVRNQEKQFLPTSFVVNSWDPKSDVLRSSEAHHQTWERVGKFDLPVTTLVVRAMPGKLEARSLRLSNHKLLP
jgi:hypothetical protein